VGQCQTAAIVALGGRFGPLIRLVLLIVLVIDIRFEERITGMSISLKRLLHPSPPNATATVLRMLPAVLMTALAAASYRAKMPVAALICSAIAARISTVSAAVLLALMVYQASADRV
jgi:hypothetical protein